jgi:SAM-dependent methyltransferase
MNQKSGYEKCAHLYDLFDTKQNIDLFLGYAQKAGEILDIGAGTGRIAIPIAEYGIKVTCVEPSPAMRNVFMQKLKALAHLSNRITVLGGDAWSFALNRRFPAALLSGTFDHFLSDQEREASLLNIRRYLQKDGILVFDVFLGLMKNSKLKPAGEACRGKSVYRRFVGSKVLQNGTIDTLLRFEIYESGKLVDTIEEHSFAGIVDRQTVHSLLDRTGFSLRKEYGDYDATSYRTGDALLIIEAESKA